MGHFAFARESGDTEVDTRAGLATGMLGRSSRPRCQKARRALELARRNGHSVNEATPWWLNARAAGDGREAAGFYAAEAAERFERSYNWPLAAALRWLLVR